MAIDSVLQERWKLWRECLIGDDPNSIFQQIYQMTWDAAIFRMIMESRQLLIKQNPDEPTINPRLHSFIDRNFFQAQAARIRRLYDNYELDGPRGVYSLRSLIKDICKHRYKITRENIFQFHKTPYDYKEIKALEQQFISQNRENAFLVPSDLNWETSQETHITYDRLSGKTYQNRTPQDLIEKKVFVRLLEKLASCHEVAKYVDKYVAHSATPNSRIVNDENATTTTWKSIWDCHQNIYEVANFLSGILYSQDHIPLAWELPSLLNFWDAPIVNSESMPQIIIAWEKFRMETEIWRLYGKKRVWQWIEE